MPNQNKNGRPGPANQANPGRGTAEGSPADPQNALDSTPTINLGAQLKMMCLNIEGISMPKCDYLGELLRKHNIDVLIPPRDPPDRQVASLEVPGSWLHSHQQTKPRQVRHHDLCQEP